MLIASGKLRSDALHEWVVIVTGAGGGIGFEAARALLWLGATVVIAEIDADSGRDAQARLSLEFAPERVAFIPTDVGDAKSVHQLLESAVARFGRVDAVINNATYAWVGTAVAETPIDIWDRSYAVNLRGPALLAATALPAMIERHRGVFACVSSTGGPFLASYEALKAAQVAMAASLDGELEGTGVVAFTIGPGLVPTPTASKAIELLAPKLGMSVDQFWAANRGAVLSVEAAGAGFAAAIALAPRYGGQEISSGQALIDAGIDLEQGPAETSSRAQVSDSSEAVALCGRVRDTLASQADGWKERSFFERQWMVRDFKQHAGVPIERCLEALTAIQARIASGAAPTGAERQILVKLAGFYAHMAELARGYVKDVAQRDQQMALIGGWKGDVDRLVESVTRTTAVPVAGHM
jgi:NAD(P)-dependent dehydrogenase (short-subunit alcohol dehydrogenase family)